VRANAARTTGQCPKWDIGHVQRCVPCASVLLRKLYGARLRIPAVRSLAHRLVAVCYCLGPTAVARSQDPRLTSAGWTPMTRRVAARRATGSSYFPPNKQTSAQTNNKCRRLDCVHLLLRHCADPTGSAPRQLGICDHESLYFQTRRQSPEKQQSKNNPFEGQFVDASEEDDSYGRSGCQSWHADAKID